MFEFAPAFANPKGSPIRELFKYTTQPGMIAFSGGSPAPALFDSVGLEKAANKAYQRHEACLQYGSTGGANSLRQEIVRLMDYRGVSIKDEEFIVTTGSQQGLDLLLRIMIQPGDTVIMDTPAYPATLQAMRLQGANIVTIASDNSGMDVDALEILLGEGSITSRPKLVYTVPTFANPTGSTLSRERRIKLLELAERFDFIVVEDDPYSELRFSGQPIPSLLALSGSFAGARERIVHLSSLSKIVAPGLRVGWMIGHPEIIKRCNIAKQTADLCSPPWTQEIAATYLKDKDLHAHIRHISVAYGGKCHAMCRALTEGGQGLIEFSEPEGGLFVWARLRNGLDAEDLLKQAIERKVIFVPGVAFYTESPDRSAFRLSYATASEAEIEEGVSRLCDALRSLADLATVDG